MAQKYLDLRNLVKEQRPTHLFQALAIHAVKLGQLFRGPMVHRSLILNVYQDDFLGASRGKTFDQVESLVSTIGEIGGVKDAMEGAGAASLAFYPAQLPCYLEFLDQDWHRGPTGHLVGHAS